MAITTVTPCGLICDICIGFQRTKNRCSGCAGDFKPAHCTKCSILNCPEKQFCSGTPCDACAKYPCKRLKNLEKRYSLKYGESLMENFRRIEALGLDGFLQAAEAEWTCPAAARCSVFIAPTAFRVARPMPDSQEIRNGQNCDCHA
jgi:hypothetical protein